MTKYEMVQRLYIQYSTAVDSGGDFSIGDSSALQSSIEGADYFFKNYKPKKKREVMVIDHISRFEFQQFRQNAGEYVGNALATPSGLARLIEWHQASQAREIFDALMAGKSVRMK